MSKASLDRRRDTIRVNAVNAAAVPRDGRRSSEPDTFTPSFFSSRFACFAFLRRRSAARPLARQVTS